MYDSAANLVYVQKLRPPGGMQLICAVSQQNILYTFDPKAMHHIAVKDQDVFQEARWFTRYVGDKSWVPSSQKAHARGTTGCYTTSSGLVFSLL